MKWVVFWSIGVIAVVLTIVIPGWLGLVLGYATAFLAIVTLTEMS
jgi:hypothetical protein